jgi:hypothetical protein
MSYSQGYGPFLLASTPVAGTDEIQTLTIGGTPTEVAGSGFRLSFGGLATGLILWSATNATLVANIDAALELLGSIGVGGVVTAVGVMTAGVGTITITFSGANHAKKAQPPLVVTQNALTGTAPTVAITETTPGVEATFRGSALPGALLYRTDAGNVKAFQNTGTLLSPIWTAIGSQVP